jgi:transposase
MRRFHFTEEDLRTLQHERYHHPHPRVQQKMEVVWLISQGLIQEEAARLAGVGRRTVVRYLTEFHEGGVAALRQLSFHKPQSELVRHQDDLETHFLNNPPVSVAQAQQVIEQRTGIRRGETQVRHF